MTLAILNLSVKMPDIRDWLIVSVIHLDISSFINFNSSEEIPLSRDRHVIVIVVAGIYEFPLVGYLTMARCVQIQSPGHQFYGLRS